MAELSLLEKIKDKASRILPSPFGDHIESATSELLISADPRAIQAICDLANVPGNETDIVRALRFRLDDDSPKVRCLAVVVLDSLFRRCGTVVHEEIAQNKGLLRALVVISTAEAHRQTEAEARTAALQLVLNLSYWFVNVSGSEHLAALAQIANHARTAGAHFGDLQADTTVQMRAFVAPPPHLVAGGSGDAPHRQLRRAADGQRRRRPEAQRPGRRRDVLVVEAVPVESPGEEELGRMMDAVMLLAEMASAAAPGAVDDVLLGVAQQVQRDHTRLFRLVTVGVEFAGKDAVATVVESQEAVLDQVDAVKRGERLEPPQHQAPAEAASAPGGAGETLAPVIQPAEQVPPAGGSAPSMDELFGGPPAQAMASTEQSAAMPAGTPAGTPAQDSSTALPPVLPSAKTAAPVEPPAEPAPPPKKGPAGLPTPGQHMDPMSGPSAAVFGKKEAAAPAPRPPAETPPAETPPAETPPAEMASEAPEPAVANAISAPAAADVVVEGSAEVSMPGAEPVPADEAMRPVEAPAAARADTETVPDAAESPEAAAPEMLGSLNEGDAPGAVPATTAPAAGEDDFDAFLNERLESK